MTTIFSGASFAFQGHGTQDSGFFQQLSSASAAGSFQLVTPQATAEFPHAVFVSATALVANGMLLVGAGDGVVTAVLMTSNSTTATKSTSWRFHMDDLREKETKATATFGGAATTVSFFGCPTRSNSAFGVIGTASGSCVTFIATAKGNRVVLELQRNKRVFALEDAILSSAIICDESGRFEHIALASAMGVQLLNPFNLEHRQTIPVTNAIRLISPSTSPVRYVGKHHNVHSCLYIVGEDRAIYKVSIHSQPGPFHEESDVSSNSKFEITFDHIGGTAVVTQNQQQSSSSSVEVVHDADLFIGGADAADVSTVGVTMCGTGWWGFAGLPFSQGWTVDDEERSEVDPRGQPAADGARATAVRTTLTTAKLSIVRAITQDVVVFSAGSDLYVGSCVSSLGGTMMKPLRLVSNFSLPLNDIVALDAGQNSSAACAIAVVGNTLQLFSF